MNRYSTILSGKAPVEPTRSNPGGEQVGDDEFLFSRFLDGDDAAFMEFFNRHSSRLQLYCLKFLNNRGHARDVMQDLWERVIDLRTQGKPSPQRPLGFVLRMAHNLCLNHLRYQERRRHDSFDTLPEWRHPTTPRQEMSEMEEAVVIALGKLPQTQREILILNAYSGYRFDEIAEMLGEPVGAVRMRAWRARAKLGDIITAMTGLREADEAEGRIDGGCERTDDDDREADDREPQEKQ
jgi:RNA polymerase sigma-70 factor (ECF subfamily)